MGQAKRHVTKIRPKAVGGGMFGHFSNFGKCQSEVAGDVISGVAIDYVGADVRASRGGSETVTEIFDSLAGQIRFMHHFCAIRFAADRK